MKWIWIAPLPVLLCALWLPDITWQAPAVLFGLQWQLDGLSRPFLIMTSLLWLLAGVYAKGYFASDEAAPVKGASPEAERSSSPSLTRFQIFWLLTLIGNLSLIVARDIASFYTGFALMTFAAYGLVIHSASREALQAGRVYLTMALIGEVLLLAGFLWLLPDMVEPMLHYVPLAIASHEQGTLAAALLFAGFGVKAGVLGLHLWLPLAHPVAPTPASAVLSGAMIKAGLLAWLQVLPLGDEARELIGQAPTFLQFAEVVIVLGLAAAFLAGIAGVLQRQVKAVLAYSSISQMGLMTALLGLALYYPAVAPLLLPVVVVYAIHHGFAKGALFLMVGFAQHPGRLKRAVVLGLAALPALALAGAPLTSGAAAKYLMKDALYGEVPALMVTLLSATASATAALMLRFFYLLCQQNATPAGQDTARAPLRFATCASVAVSLVAIWWLEPRLPFAPLLPLASLWDASWPMAVAVLLALLAWPLQQKVKQTLSKTTERALYLPAGDLLWPLLWLGRQCAKPYGALNHAAHGFYHGFTQLLGRAARGFTRALALLHNKGLNEALWQRHSAWLMPTLLLTFALLLVIR